MSALRRLLCAICAAGFFLTNGHAQSDARYEKLAHEFRCLVCQNQTLAESSAELAQDLKNELRQLISQGKSDAEIKAYLRARYGDFVLYTPPVQSNTYLLWTGPFIALLGGALIAFVLLRKRKPALPSTDATSSPLTVDERAELERHLG